MINYSFIIPHRNCPLLLDRCINSIPQQNETEIIVVDDNSDADKRPTCKRHDVKIIYLSELESKGAGHARNVGMDEAIGKWLLFADCDDYYEDGFMDSLSLYCNTNIDILYFRAFTRIEGDTSGSVQRSWIDKAFDVYQRSGKTLKDAHWLGLSHTCPWNKMYNHMFLKEHNCRFEEIAIGNDAWFVNYAGAEATQIEVVDEHLYNYMILSNGITKGKRPLSQHLDVIKSDKKRNKLKVKAGCYDLLFVPGFNKEVVIRDFGRKTYWHLFLKRVLTEPYFDLALLFVLFRKLHIFKEFK